MTREKAILVLDSLSTWLGYERPITEEIIEAIKTLSQSSLPSNLDETAEKYGRNTFINECMDNGVCDDHDLSDAFKAGAEWMAGQGVNIRGRVLPGPHGNSYVESDWFDKRYGGLSWNDEVELTIRKKQ